MPSIGVVRSSMAAASYFAKDNYYTQYEEGPSHWFGAGAEKLGLTGEVEAGRFKQLLEAGSTPRPSSAASRAASTSICTAGI